MYENSLFDSVPKSVHNAVIEEKEKLKNELEKSVLRLKNVGRLERDRDEVMSAAAVLQKRLDEVANEQRALETENASLRKNLDFAEAQKGEVELKYEALQRFREVDLQKSVSLGRKEIKDRSKALLGMFASHVKSLEAQLMLQNEVNEMESNLLLLEQLDKGETTIEGEKVETQASLDEKRVGLDALSVVPFDFEKLSSTFADSPPLPESKALQFDDDARTSAMGG